MGFCLSCAPYYIPISTALGTAWDNSTNIQSSCFDGGIIPAVFLCRNVLINNNLYNFALPSKDDLNKMYLNRAAIGGFSGVYWSSSEYDADNAWVQSFEDGTQYPATKSNATALSVRGIYYF
jgi:hypothetical protein